MDQWTKFDDVVTAFRRGEMVIIADPESRENEGDLTIATEAVSADALAFMIREARGLICVSLSPDRAQQLGIPYQSANNNSVFGTPFGVSLDHKSVAVSGFCADARATTMRRLVAADAKADEFSMPGHVFPLIADPAGVIGRQGQTEGSFDLARIAGFKPSGVICEILNPDGSMARGAQLFDFAKRYGLPITNVEEIARYRLAREVLVRETGRGRLQTDVGIFDAVAFENDADGREHLALIYGAPQLIEPPLVRIHSECLTGDVFGSRRCDCGAQLTRAMELVVKEGSGILLYLRQEGRGIGLLNKLRAYELQDGGQDTVQANIALGFEADVRDFVVAARILESLGVSAARLLTNNPRKIGMLETAGLRVTERIPLIVPATEFSRSYLETKRSKLGHLLDSGATVASR